MQACCGEISCLQVSSGGVALSGTVLGTLPALVAINGSQCGPVPLQGNLVLTKGRTMVEVVQALKGVTEVSLIWLVG